VDTHCASKFILPTMTDFINHTAFFSGPNFLDFLTSTYNQSYIQTYNCAVSGATRDNNLVPPILSSFTSFTERVQNEFFSDYANRPSFAAWMSLNSLFGIYIGVNDLNNLYEESSLTDLYTEIFKVFTSTIDQVPCPPKFQKLQHT
jgi:hypothetical protein